MKQVTFKGFATESLDVTQGVAKAQRGGTMYTTAISMAAGGLGFGGPILVVALVFSEACNAVTLTQALTFVRSACHQVKVPFVPPANVQLDHGKAENSAFVRYFFGALQQPGTTPACPPAPLPAPLEARGAKPPCRSTPRPRPALAPRVRDIAVAGPR